MVVALPMLVLLVFLLGGVPIAVALAGSGMLGIWLITGDLAKVLNIVGLVPFSSVADYQLTTIPMFILMAYFSASSGLARTSMPPPPPGCRISAAALRSRPCSLAGFSARCRGRAPRRRR